jgi:uncharacterized membrane protein
MSKVGWRIRNNIRNRLVGGLLVVVPLAATVILLRFVFLTLDGFLAPIIAHFVGFHVPGLGLVLMLAGLYILGSFTANVLGRRVFGFGERVLTAVPLVRGIYTSSKLLMESMMSQRKSQFSRVVIVEYPRRGLYTLAFVTNENVRSLSDGEKLTAIFVPTTPNPTSGFMLLVPESDLISTPFTIEEGVKLVVSGGLIAPDPNTIPHLGGRRAH